MDRRGLGIAVRCRARGGVETIKEDETVYSTADEKQAGKRGSGSDERGNRTFSNVLVGIGRTQLTLARGRMAQPAEANSDETPGCSACLCGALIEMAATAESR